MRLNIICWLLVLLVILSGCQSVVQPSDSVTATSTTLHSTTETTQTAATPSYSSSTVTNNVTTTTIDGTTTTADTVGTVGNSNTAVTTHSDKTTSVGRTTTKPTITTTTGANDDYVTFKATIRENINRQPVNGVTVTVYVDSGSSPSGSGVTDQKGIVQIHMRRGASYKVVLSNLPTEYEAEQHYLFSSATVNITINKSSIRNEEDHSNAQYKEGDVMTDFSLTDTDDNNHRLSTLLKEKQLVILDFWYVSCEPCKSEFPLFEAAVNRYGDKMTLLAVNPFDNQNSIKKLREQLNAKLHTSIHFPMLEDTCNLYAGFGVRTYPTTVFINADGVILNIYEGAFSSESELFAIIEQYLQ